MSTATAEPTVISQDYVSKCENLRLVKDPIRKRQLGEGTDFITTNGELVQFRDGRFTATTQELIDWLDEHPSNGIHFHKIGFGSDGRTADDSAGIIKSVIELAFTGDYQKIADILVAERSTYARPDVIAACETVLNGVGDTPPEAPAGS